MVVGLAFIVLGGALLTKSLVQEEALKLEALPAPPTAFLLCAPRTTRTAPHLTAPRAHHTARHNTERPRPPRRASCSAAPRTSGK